MTECFEPVEEKQSMTIHEFVTKHHIGSDYIKVAGNPNLFPCVDDAWAKNANHYSVALHREGPTMMTVPYSMGKAHKNGPTAADVLSSLALDAQSVHGGRDFEDWAHEYGYDPDSRKAERTYQAACRQTQELRRFLGECAYGELLFEVETD